EDQDHGQPGESRRFHVLRRASESDHAHVHAPVHAPNQWVQQEDREPRACRCSALHVLQLRAHPQDAARDARDGSWNRGPCMVTGRNRGAGARAGSQAARALQETQHYFLTACAEGRRKLLATIRSPEKIAAGIAMASSKLSTKPSRTANASLLIAVLQ